MKSICRLILVLAVMIGFIYGGCGSCSVSKKDTAVPSGDFVIKVNNGITQIQNNTLIIF